MTCTRRCADMNKRCLGLGLGLLLVLCVPLAAGMGSARGVTIGGFNYTGWMWVFFLVFGVLSILAVKALDRDCRVVFPYRPWLLWFGFVGVSLIWCENLGVRNLQDLIQISMPLVIGIVASFFVTTEAQLKLLLRMFGVTLLLICFALVGTPLGLFGGLDMSEGIRPMGFTTTLIGCVFIAGCPDKLKTPLLMWGVCVLVATATGGRMATIVLLLLPILHPLLSGWRWRVMAVVAMAGLGLVLFYTPLFQERFFYTGSGTLTDLFQGQVRGQRTLRGLALDVAGSMDHSGVRPRRRYDL